MVLITELREIDRRIKWKEEPGGPRWASHRSQKPVPPTLRKTLAPGCAQFRLPHKIKVARRLFHVSGKVTGHQITPRQTAVGRSEPAVEFHSLVHLRDTFVIPARKQKGLAVHAVGS